MGGVDLADQRIAYYHPDLRCRRNWLPMFLQVVSIVRNNSYIVYKDFTKKKPLSHKEFTMEMIAALMDQAHATYQQPSRTRSPKGKFSSTSTHPSPNLALKCKKRPRTAADASIKSLLTQYPQRQMGRKEEHAPSSVGYKRRGACIWCTMEFQEKKRSGETVNWNNEVKRTARMCAYCNQNSIENKSCFLCSEHFNTFHEYD